MANFYNHLSRKEAIERAKARWGRVARAIWSADWANASQGPAQGEENVAAWGDAAAFFFSQL